MEIAAMSLGGNVGKLLAEVAAEEYQLLCGVGGEATELRLDLATMNALLRMESEADEGAADHFAVEWMKQLRELAYDAEDSVDMYKLRIKCPTSGGRSLWFKVPHLLRTLAERRRLAGELRAIRDRAISISERHARYGVDRDALRRSRSFASVQQQVGVPATPAARAMPAGRATGVGSTGTTGTSTWMSRTLHRISQILSGSGDPGPDPDHHNLQFDDLGGHAQNLTELLVKDENSFRVLSVVGFGGVGKTTVAQEVCRRLQPQFPYQAMVTVSPAFEPGRHLDQLLGNIRQQIVDLKITGHDREEAAIGSDNLNHYLSGKRYFILIDDVWTAQAWEAIQSKLPAAQYSLGSRIIVTTRIEKVAEACSHEGDIYTMKGLDVDDSRKLFLKVYGNKKDVVVPKELEDTMYRILKKCGGMPLAIVSIAKILEGEEDKDKWEKVCRSIGSDLVVKNHTILERVRQAVALSYNHLPYELKGCMMYLSIFPEDHEINKKRLLSRWIAEGLVPEKRGLTLMEVAEDYLDDLVSRNMVIPRYGDDGKVESCRVHDILLQVMVSKSLECNFVSILGGQHAAMSYDRIDRIRRLSIQGVDEKVKPQGGEQQLNKKMTLGSSSRCSSIKGLDVKHVRSLSMFNQVAEHTLLNDLHKFTLLRVLDLEGCEGLEDAHLNHVCRMYLLRFLSVKTTNVKKMPRQIGKLEHLQILDASDTCLKELPTSMTKLVKLERIEFKNKHEWKILWDLPLGIKDMKALRELHRARLGDDVQVANELGELQNLQDIGMYIDCEDNPQVLRELALSLSKLSSLRRLDLSNMSCATEKKGGRLDFLQDMATPPRQLRILRLEGHLDWLPPWVGSLTNLVQFVIMHTKLTNDDGRLFNILCKLPKLKSIVLQQKCYMDSKIVARASHKFKVLRHLEVSSDWIPEPKVIKFEPGSMETLEELCISFNKLHRRIVGTEYLTGLKRVILVGKENNPSLISAVEELKNKKFQVVVKYH